MKFRLAFDDNQATLIRTCHKGHKIAFENMTADGRCAICAREARKHYPSVGKPRKPRLEPNTGKPAKRREIGRRGKGEPYYLDPAPFVRWIAEEAARRQMTVPYFCDQMGINRRTERRMRNGEGGKPITIALDMVDEVLIQTGTHLWEVYPELYECGEAF